MLAVLVATTAAPPGPAPSAAELVRPVLEETLQEWLTHYYYNNGESAEPRGSIAAAVYVEATGETVATAGGKIDCANTTTMNMSKPAGGDDTLPACQQDAGAHDPYPLGSITKMYTGARVMQLIEQGRLRLDSRVAPIVDPYLAWLNATGHNVWLPSLAARFGAQVQNLTVHDLLHMRVGACRMRAATTSTPVPHLPCAHASLTATTTAHLPPCVCSSRQRYATTWPHSRANVAACTCTCVHHDRG